MRTWELKRQGDVAAVSCKRRDLLRLPLADFRRLAPRVQEAFAWVGSFLERQCIVCSTDLPYRTQLVPLAAVRAIVGDETDTEVNDARITRWYWCGVLGEMYGGSTESRFPRDVEQLTDWIQGECETVPDTVVESAFLDDRLDSLATRNSAAYKGIYALLIKQGAVDWYFIDEPLSPARLVEHSVNVRHIFPKGWFVKNPVDRPSRMHSIVNKTPLSLRAARSVSGSPHMYLKSLSLESGMRPEWFDDVIGTHLIDVPTLRAGAFDKFYDDRARKLRELVMSAMGKPTVSRDSAAW